VIQYAWYQISRDHAYHVHGISGHHSSKLNVERKKNQNRLTCFVLLLRFFVSKMNIVVALLQFGVVGSPDENLSILSEQCARLGSLARPLIIVCPELFLTGYGCPPDNIRKYAEPLDGPSFKRIASLAKSHHAAIAYGYSELEQQRVFNSLRFVDENGISQMNYRKTHLFGQYERDIFAAGDCILPPFAYHGLNIALLICFDVEHCEAVRDVRLKKTDLLISVAANSDQFVNKSMIPTRAYENGMYVVYCNRTGDESTFKLCGGSEIIAPNGTILAQAPFYETGVAIATLPVDYGEKFKRHVTVNNYLQVRRPEIYTNLMSK